MHFEDPQNFIWLWLLPVFFLTVVIARRFFKKRSQQFIRTPRLRSLSFVPWEGKRFYLRLILITASVFCLIFSLSRPQWGFDWELRMQKGSDIMIVLDLSKSMLAKDLPPNRLEVAKRKILDLLERLRGDRVGLIGFAGSAYVQCPLTSDYDAFRMFLDFMSVESISRQGTSFTPALSLAAESLRVGGEINSDSSAILMLTDGEDHDPEIKTALEKLKKEKIKVFVIGVGSSDGAPIPSEQGGFKKNKKGDLILSRLNEPLLENLASNTGGSYARLDSGDRDLDKIYNEGIKDQLVDKDITDQRVKNWHDQFVWFIVFALILFFLESVLFDRRKKRVSSYRSLSLFLVAVSAGLIFVQSDSARSAENLDKSPISSYNRGVDNYRKGDFDAARNDFAWGAKSEDPQLAGQSLFNLGNTEAQVSNFEGAITAYEEALKYQPNEKRILENLEAVKKLEEQKKQDKQNGEPENKKDQNNATENNQKSEADKSGKPKSDDSSKGDSKDSGQSPEKNDKGKDGQPKPDSQENSKNEKPEKASEKESDEASSQEKPGDEQGSSSDSDKAKEGDPEKKSPEEKDNKEVDKGKIAPRQAEQILREVEDKASKYLGPSNAGNQPKGGEEKRDASDLDW